ncbi:MAG TPA: polysaccharide deacetylase family protein [Flavitalea sp.]|nr:polysaccharide deacetylase family protein [Flavitalea sp.]
MMLILVHSVTNRLSYLFDWMFSGQPGILYVCTTDPWNFDAFTGAKFQYGGIRRTIDHPYWPSYGLLEETGVREQAMDLSSAEMLFPISGELGTRHDPFSACFYLLSRYEEYLSFRADNYGRFEAAQSVLAKKGMTEYPLADALKQTVITELLDRYPQLSYTPFPFRSTITIDIDQAFEFTGKSRIRTLGSVVKSALSDPKRLARQLKVLAGSEPDPYDTYDFILNELGRSRLPFLFFILCRSGTSYDRQVTIDHPKFEQLISKLSNVTEPGIHPSFYTHEQPARLKTEIQFLQSLTGTGIRRSRQHYLRLFIPSTYRALETMKIREDYSMGYASIPGFRAGTCSEFLWYDLENESCTSLKIFPVTMMEGTFAEQMDLSMEQAWKRITSLIDTVERFSGHFIPIWHNHTVSTTEAWNDWRTIFIKMIHTLEQRIP